MSATICSLRTPKAGHSASDQRPPGWSDHPSNPTLSCEKLLPVLSFDALQLIASGLAQTQRALPEDNNNATAARSIRLIATALYDVWLISWPEGTSIGPHDHGGARSVLHVVAGELTETFSDQLDVGARLVRVLRRGDSAYGDVSLLHELTNRSGLEATSLHVYSPPLSDLTFFSRFPGGQYKRGRMMAVPERSARASSRDHDVVRPPVLQVGRA